MKFTIYRLMLVLAVLSVLPSALLFDTEGTFEWGARPAHVIVSP
jgi:hypothetical protein